MVWIWQPAYVHGDKCTLYNNKRIMYVAGTHLHLIWSTVPRTGSLLQRTAHSGTEMDDERMVTICVTGRVPTNVQWNRVALISESEHKNLSYMRCRATIDWWRRGLPSVRHLEVTLTCSSDITLSQTQRFSPRLKLCWGSLFTRTEREEPRILANLSVSAVSSVW